MTENNQTQDTQADFNKSQQPEAGAAKQGQADQTLNQTKTGQEDKTFQTGQADRQAQSGNPDFENETELDDDADDSQAETSST